MYTGPEVISVKEYYEILRELREDRDLTQSDIANLLGTTQQVYSRYENGVNELPIRHLITLCRYYNVTSDYVLGLGSQSPPVGGADSRLLPR